MTRVTLIAAAFAIAISTSATATAQTIISPSLSTLSSFTTGGSNSKLGYGVAFGKLGKKKVSLITDIAYYPQVIDKDALLDATSRALTFSVDWLIGPMIGRVKPYGAFGFGEMYLKLTTAPVNDPEAPPGFASTTNYITINGGPGVIVFFNKHLGVRGDLRRVRAYNLNTKTSDTSGNPDGSDDSGGSGLSSLKFSHIDFWRFGFGLVASFGSEKTK